MLLQAGGLCSPHAPQNLSERTRTCGRIEAMERYQSDQMTFVYPKINIAGDDDTQLSGDSDDNASTSQGNATSIPGDTSAPPPLPPPQCQMQAYHRAGASGGGRERGLSTLGRPPSTCPSPRAAFSPPRSAGNHSPLERDAHRGFAPGAPPPSPSPSPYAMYYMMGPPSPQHSSCRGGITPLVPGDSASPSRALHLAAAALHHAHGGSGGAGPSRLQFGGTEGPLLEGSYDLEQGGQPFPPTAGPTLVTAMQRVRSWIAQREEATLQSTRAAALLSSPRSATRPDHAYMLGSSRLQESSRCGSPATRYGSNAPVSANAWTDGDERSCASGYASDSCTRINAATEDRRALGEGAESAGGDGVASAAVLAAPTPAAAPAVLPVPGSAGRAASSGLGASPRAPSSPDRPSAASGTNRLSPGSGAASGNSSPAPGAPRTSPHAALTPPYVTVADPQLQLPTVQATANPASVGEGGGPPVHACSPMNSPARGGGGALKRSGRAASTAGSPYTPLGHSPRHQRSASTSTHASSPVHALYRSDAGGNPPGVSHLAPRQQCSEHGSIGGGTSGTGTPLRRMGGGGWAGASQGGGSTPRERNETDKYVDRLLMGVMASHASLHNLGQLRAGGSRAGSVSGAGVAVAGSAPRSGALTPSGMPLRGTHSLGGFQVTPSAPSTIQQRILSV